MLLIVIFVVIALLLSWRPLSRIVPSESLLAGMLAGVGMTTLLLLGQAG